MIYFVQSGEDSIKIGYSSHVAERMRSLQLTYGDLRMLGVMVGTLQDERALHREFAHHRISGEWFRPDKEIIDFISENACPDIYDDHIEISIRVNAVTMDTLTKRADAMGIDWKVIAGWGLTFVAHALHDEFCSVVGRIDMSTPGIEPQQQPPEFAEVMTAARDALQALDYQASQGNVERQHNDALRDALAPFAEDGEAVNDE